MPAGPATDEGPKTLCDHDCRCIDVAADEVRHHRGVDQRKQNGCSSCRSALHKGIANGFNKATAFCNAPIRVNRAPGFSLHKRPFAFIRNSAQYWSNDSEGHLKPFPNFLAL